MSKRRLSEGIGPWIGTATNLLSLRLVNDRGSPSTIPCMFRPVIPLVPTNYVFLLGPLLVSFPFRPLRLPIVFLRLPAISLVRY